MNAPSTMQILSHTPVWIWFLLAGLIALGLSQTRSRTAPFARLMLAPVALTALSLQGVLASFGGNTLAMALWPLGAAAVAWVILQRPANASTSYNTDTRTFHIAGSWVPLALIMAIFCGKYIVGATLSMHPEMAQVPSFALPVCMINGAISGIFIARATRLWQLTQA